MKGLGALNYSTSSSLSPTSSQSLQPFPLYPFPPGITFGPSLWHPPSDPPSGPCPASPPFSLTLPSHPPLRAVPGIYYQEGAVEVMTVYFEDSRVNSGIANMGIRKALWPMVSGGGAA